MVSVVSIFLTTQLGNDLKVIGKKEMRFVEIVPSNDLMSAIWLERWGDTQRPGETVATFGSIANRVHNIALNTGDLCVDFVQFNLVEISKNTSTGHQIADPWSRLTISQWGLHSDFSEGLGSFQR